MPNDHDVENTEYLDPDSDWEQYGSDQYEFCSSCGGIVYREPDMQSLVYHSNDDTEANVDCQRST